MGTQFKLWEWLLPLVLLSLLDCGTAEVKGDPSYPGCTAPGKFRKNDNCQEYYVCIPKQTGFEQHRLACQHPLVYKQEWGFCVMPEMAPECAIVENPGNSKCVAPGRFSNRDCKGYYVCFPNFIGGGLRRMEVPCTPGTFYSEAFGMCALRPDPDQKCVSDDQESEQERKARESGKFCVAQGTFALPGCRQYMICVTTEEGTYVSHDFSCPQDTYYSEDLRICVDADEAPDSCGLPKTTVSRERRGTKKDCTATGKFADKGCKTYYFCTALPDGTFKVSRFTCPPGLFFSEKLKVCVPDTTAPECFPTPKPPVPTCPTCPNICANETTLTPPTTTTTTPTTTSSTTSTTTTTESTTIYTSVAPPGKCPNEGMFPEGDDCKHFFVCTKDGKGGHLITHMTCGKDTYFAEEEEMCTSIVPAKCKKSTTTTTTTTTTSTTTTTPPPTKSTKGPSTAATAPPPTTAPPCKPPPCKEPGKFPVQCDCSMYYTCTYYYFGLGGPLIQRVFTCAEENFYNIKKERCTPSALVEECIPTTTGTTTPRMPTTTPVSATTPATTPFTESTKGPSSTTAVIITGSKGTPTTQPGKGPTTTTEIVVTASKETEKSTAKPTTASTKAPTKPTTKTPPTESTKGPTESTKGPTKAPTESTKGPTESTKGPTKAPTESTKGPTEPTKGPTESTKGPTESTKGPTKAPTESTKGPTESTKGPTESTKGPTESTKGPTKAPTESTKGPTEATKGPTEATKGPTESTKGPTESTKGPTESTKGPTEAPPTESTKGPSTGSTKSTPIFTLTFTTGKEKTTPAVKTTPSKPPTGPVTKSTTIMSTKQPYSTPSQPSTGTQPPTASSKPSVPITVTEKTTPASTSKGPTTTRIVITMPTTASTTPRTGPTTTVPPDCVDLLTEKDYTIDGLTSQLKQYAEQYFLIMDELSRTVEDLTNCNREANKKDAKIAEQQAQIDELNEKCESWLSKLTGK